MTVQHPKMRILYSIICSFLLALFAEVAYPQARQPEQSVLSKLDPRFHGIVAEIEPALGKAMTLPQPNVLATRENGEEVFGAIVYTSDPEALRQIGIPVNSILPGFVTARVTRHDLLRLARSEAVQYVDAGDVLYPVNDVTRGWIGSDILHAGYLNETPFLGTGVLVCFIDTGVDWSHLDFRDPLDDTKSRIVSIWDQTLSRQGSESSPSEAGANYGVEYTRAHIENEIDGSPANFVRTTDDNGHGTLVAGVAVGNGASLPHRKYTGVAPGAELIIVKGGAESVAEANIIDALSYAHQKALSLGKPLVVNMSLGSIRGAHDGSDAGSMAIDAFSGTGSGRVVVVSAGNEGDSNVHRFAILDRGDSFEFRVNVPSYTAESGSDNDDIGLQVWFNGSGSVSLQVTSPNGYSISQNSSGSKAETTNDGTILIQNGVSTVNGDRFVEAYIFDDNASKTPGKGTWVARVTNNSSGEIHLHGWLYDYSVGKDDEAATLEGGDSEYTLSNEATSSIVVGSYAHRYRWTDRDGLGWWGGDPDRSDDLSPSSGRGPTRTGIWKPDVTAPGLFVVSSKSKDYAVTGSQRLTSDQYTLSAGTSLSAPAVAGAAALILEQMPELTSDRVMGFIKQFADTDDYTGPTWNRDWGYGRLNIFRPLVKAMYPNAAADHEILMYDQWGAPAGTPTGIRTLDFKFALRFTPSIDGAVTGLFFHPADGIYLTGPLNFEIWRDHGSRPQSKMGNTVQMDHDEMEEGTWNFVHMLESGANVEAGKEYHIVLYPAQGDSMIILMDAGQPDNRAHYTADGFLWIAYPNDFRMRPVITSHVDAATLDVSDEESTSPLTFQLSQNYPNPFNPSTMFTYQIPEPSEVTIHIYDILGRTVRTLIDSRLPAGKYTGVWDGMNEEGESVASGVYFLRMKAGDFKSVRKITLMR